MTMTFSDNLLRIDASHFAVFTQHTLITAQTHCSTHVRNVLLIFHQVNHVVCSLGVHLHTIGIGIAKHVARELYYHHLHPEANTKSRNIVLPTIFSSHKFAFHSTLTEARTYHNPVHTSQCLCNILVSKFLGIYEMGLYLIIIIGTSLRKRFQDTLISILQVILPNQGNVYNFCCFMAPIKERPPRTKSRSFSNRHT